MNDREFENLENQLEELTRKISELQDIYRAETGENYICSGACPEPADTPDTEKRVGSGCFWCFGDGVNPATGDPCPHCS